MLDLTVFPLRIHASQFDVWLLYRASDYRTKDGDMLSFAPVERREKVEHDAREFLAAFDPIWNNRDVSGHTDQREAAINFLFECGVFNENTFRQWPDFVTVLKHEVQEGRVIAIHEERHSAQLLPGQS